ncbi:MAG TPA: SDR family oxidoreductase [Synergistales bacterium]|nr:MAG: Short-chain dehydrogenase/reductase SDR [Synergistales bacterium 57_84]KUK88893.1 MAG: Short-chain dehydrogenase/reductase SDR [Synergistales bacterium 58_81]HPA58323.1 SDR family oxidoreductase [Synergistales bacterium]HQO83334.1 SDR family oxidoreductase [Synergistales bacterium]HQQ11322.1 SDR family oxidoreductase [Synergistales bacterium]
MIDEKLFRLDGKVAVVTGGSSGIGLGCAGFLSEMGSSVVLADIDEAGGRSAEAGIGRGSLFVRCDVSSDEDCRNMASAVIARFGRVDILVNCAGVIKRKDVVQLTEKEWDLSIDITLKGIYLVSRHLIPFMARGGGGSIVNIASGWGIKGGPKAVSYCAAKGGVINMTRAMAIDHGPQNIRVNSVSPGDTDTPLLRDEARQLGIDETKWLRESAERPLKRLGTPQDIAMAVYFLASDLSPWITGANLVVDGGGTA